MTIPSPQDFGVETGLPPPPPLGGLPPAPTAGPNLSESADALKGAPTSGIGVVTGLALFASGAIAWALLGRAIRRR